jgi:hypothetical protein
MEHRHLGSQGAGCRIELLVAGRIGNDPVAGADEGKENMLVAAGGAMFRQDFIGRNMLIEMRNCLLQARSPQMGP